jgi:hypothetical protein
VASVEIAGESSEAKVVVKELRLIVLDLPKQTIVACGEIGQVQRQHSHVVMTERAWERYHYDV